MFVKLLFNKLIENKAQATLSRVGHMHKLCPVSVDTLLILDKKIKQQTFTL